MVHPPRDGGSRGSPRKRGLAGCLVTQRAPAFRSRGVPDTPLPPPAELAADQGIGSYVFDPTSRRVVWSDALCRLVGLSPGSVSRPRDVLARIDRRDLGHLLAIERDPAWHEVTFALRLRHVGGAVLPVICRAVRDVEGQRIVRERGTIHRLAQEHGPVRALAQQSLALLDRVARQDERLAALAESLRDSRRETARLARQAAVDPLTGALNRRRFGERLRQEHARLQRHPDSVSSVVLFDLDHFKTVNDRFGHPAGDSVLRRFVRLLRAQTRRQDCIGRLGGEEFAVLLPDTTAAQAVAMAQRVVDTVRGLTWTWRRRAFSLTVTAGVAELRAETPVDATMARVDKCLYVGKRRGRDQVVVDPPG